MSDVNACAVVVGLLNTHIKSAKIQEWGSYALHILCNGHRGNKVCMHSLMGEAYAIQNEARMLLHRAPRQQGAYALAMERE